MSFRNRCTVAGSNGLVDLSVPVEKGRDHHQLMRDVRVNYSGRWQQEQLRTLDSCYARSPYYEHYRDAVRGLWESRPVFLLDRNMAALEWLAKVFGYRGELSLTETYVKHYPPPVTDMRGLVLPRNARNWPSPVYTQVFQDRIGFQPNLCILDLLFCNGPSLNGV